MKIRPLYDRIVVKRIEEQESTRNGIVIPDSAKEKPQEGEVMAIGRGKRLEDGQIVALDLKAGAIAIRRRERTSRRAKCACYKEALNREVRDVRWGERQRKRRYVPR